LDDLATVAELGALVGQLATVLDNLQEDPLVDILRALFPDFHGHRNRPRFVWESLAQRPGVFWRLTGFQPDSAQTLVDEIEWEVRQPRNVRGKFPPGAIRQMRDCGLNPRNRVLVVLIWLRQYLTINAISELFCIDKTTVSNEIHHIVPILRVHFQGAIVWPDVAELEALRGSWNRYPDAVLALDCTIHPVWKPLQDPGRYYRGDKKRYCLLSLLVCDPQGLIRHIECGYRGTNDSRIYSLSEVGTGTKFLPPWALVLADGGFPDRDQLVIPFPQPQIQGNLERQYINRWHRFYRSEIERAINRMKVFRCVSQTWRHPKPFQPMTAIVCAGLTNRKLLEERAARAADDNMDL